jgi:hypothetical protein
MRLISELAQKGSLVEPWRIQAHKQAYSGATVWLLKQGKGKKGIFGVGEINGRPYRNPQKLPGANDTIVDIAIRFLVDPLKEFLIEEQELRSIVPESKIRTQGSGVTLTDKQSEALTGLLTVRAASTSWLDPKAAALDADEPQDDVDARDRIMRSIVARRGQREFRRQLLEAYEARCAVTGCPLVDVLEAAHIIPYMGSHTNHVTNGLLLRSDLHTLFDCELIWVDPTSFVIHIAQKLNGTTYEKLEGRKLRVPRKSESRPSFKALQQRYNKIRPTSGIDFS